MRILFIPMYRHLDPAVPADASDALGFGVTCADALVAGLRGRGLSVQLISSAARGRTAWTGRILERFEAALASGGYDVILAFHAFWPFTAELRRIMHDTVRCPLVTYTHGSHWDETDLFRFERYPDLRWADLGNLMAADRVLVVSSYMQDTILRNVRAVSEAAAMELTRKIRVVGLPLDLERIDSAYRRPDPGSTTICFNHAPIAAKQPGVFLDAAAEVLQRTAANILVTRHFPKRSPWAGRLAELAAGYPGRLVLGGDLSTDEYYQALWQSRVQVSTAMHESLGVATLEAMATGNQCLLPRIGSYPEIAGGDPAVLYDDAADLRARLLRAAQSPNAVLAARHSARIRLLYSPARIAVSVHSVLAEVLP